MDMACVYECIIVEIHTRTQCIPIIVNFNTSLGNVKEVLDEIKTDIIPYIEHRYDLLVNYNRRNTCTICIPINVTFQLQA